MGQLIAFLMVAMLSAGPAFAQTESEEAASAESESETTQEPISEEQQTVRRLLAIKEALESRRERIRELVGELEAADETEKPEIQQEIDEHREIVRDLNGSFESIASDGAVLSGSSKAPDEQLEWSDELTQIMRPLITSLKEATEKPRRIAELRSAIDIYQRQLEVAQRASESVTLYEGQELPPEVAEELQMVAVTWRDRSEKIERSLEAARAELNSLESQDIAIFGAIGSALAEFLLGSGLTLLLAMITGLAIWFIMRTLQRLTKKLRRQVEHSDFAAQFRVLLYSFNLLTVFLVTLAVLSVFYARGDFVLLSLAILGLAMVLLGIWRFLPGYIEEVRLLLNLGAAREGERVMYNGLPYRITSLNIHSELRNPELEGVIRLPISELAQLTSRPYGTEPWFPSRVGEYFLLPGGDFAQLIRQTVEQVHLKVVGSTVVMSSAEFFQLGARNLSRDGFGVVVGFGIDYAHQAIALDQVPERFHAGIEQAFAEAELGDDLKDLVVDFKEAAASSLDYLIYATLDGQKAASYFKIGRLIQQACVDVCNQEGWGIPFTQITLHQADED